MAEIELLVAGREQDLPAGADLRSREGFAVRWVEPVDLAATLADSARVAAVLVDGRLASGERAALSEHVRESDPSLPVFFWLHEHSSLGAVGCNPPDRVFLPTVDTDTLVRQLEHVLRVPLYRHVEALVKDAAAHALRSVLQLEVASFETYVRTHARVPHAIQGILPFSGATLAGWAIVSGSRALLGAAAARVLPGAAAGRDEVEEDLVGEAANHLVGFLKRHFDARGITVLNGCPMVVNGTSYRMRHLGRHPLLVLEAEGGEAVIQVCIDTGEPLESGAETPRSLAEGEVAFLSSRADGDVEP